MNHIKVIDKSLVVNDSDVRNAVENAEKQLGDSGRILLRESGTEPVIRVMAEAESEEICRKYVDDVVKIINEKGYTV